MPGICPLLEVSGKMQKSTGSKVSREVLALFHKLSAMSANVSQRSPVFAIAFANLAGHGSKNISRFCFYIIVIKKCFGHIWKLLSKQCKEKWQNRGKSPACCILGTFATDFRQCPPMFLKASVSTSGSQTHLNIDFAYNEAR